MESRQTILSENKAYWTGRASGYSEVNQAELETGQRQKWSDCLRGEITQQFPGMAADQLHILEAGTGPGFFAILLCELGYDVTAIDLTPAMLEEAKKNAGEMAGSIRFMEMNAESLDFEDASFDVVISRNLTWNLPNPDAAYAEWVRVLKPGGMLCVLELSTPSNRLIRWFYDLYTLHIIPWIGSKKSGDKSAYRYLPQSIAAVPQGDEMLQLMRNAGLKDTTFKRLTLGVCTIYTAVK